MKRAFNAATSKAFYNTNQTPNIRLQSGWRAVFIVARLQNVSKKSDISNIASARFLFLENKFSPAIKILKIFR